VGNCKDCGRETKGDFVFCFDCNKKRKEAKAVSSDVEKEPKERDVHDDILMGMAINNATLILCATMTNQGKSYQDAKVAYESLIKELYSLYKRLSGK
jgi:uncharacterized membrane protein YvbJ